MRRRIAPIVAIEIPPRSKDSTFPRPMKLPTKPPTIAPAIPMRIVTMIPPGSFPGMMNFAIAPAMRPRKIQEKTPMLSFLGQIRRAGKDLFCAFHSGWRWTAPSRRGLRQGGRDRLLESNGYNHRDQFSERIGFHFLHHACAVFLDGANCNS